MVLSANCVCNYLTRCAPLILRTEPPFISFVINDNFPKLHWFLMLVMVLEFLCHRKPRTHKAEPRFVFAWGRYVGSGHTSLMVISWESVVGGNGRPTEIHISLITSHLKPCGSRWALTNHHAAIQQANGHCDVGKPRWPAGSIGQLPAVVIIPGSIQQPEEEYYRTHFILGTTFKTLANTYCPLELAWLCLGV